MIRPMILHQKGSTLHITGPTLQQLIDNPRPILWCNEGLYGMIPIEIVQNEISVIQDKHLCKRFTDMLLQWSFVVEIPQETGRVLEKYNGGNDETISTSRNP